MTVVDGAWGACHLPVLQTCQQGILRAFHITKLDFFGTQWRVRQLVRFRHAAGRVRRKTLVGKHGDRQSSQDKQNVPPDAGSFVALGALVALVALIVVVVVVFARRVAARFVGARAPASADEAIVDIVA